MPSVLYTKKQKQQHVDAWRQSGLTQRAYCHQHGIKRSSFKNWSSNGSRQEPTCIPVIITSSEPVREVTLQFTSKCQVNLSIPELITVLRALC